MRRLRILGVLLMPIAMGMGYTPFPVPPEEGNLVELTNAPDGAWTWFGDPRAIHNDGWTYFGYVDTSGNVCLRTYRHDTDVVGSEIVLKAALDVDDHVNPSLLIRPDGKLQAFYARHEPVSDTMHTRVSVSTLASDPDLSDGFASEVSLDAQLVATTYDYPVPIYLSDENLIYLFWRSIPSGNNYNLVWATSADGDTWSTADTLYHNDTQTHRAYWKIASNGVDRIDFGVTNGSPNTDTTHLAHFYYDGAWRDSDGSDLGAPPAPGFEFADFTPVHTSSNSWVYDIGYVGSDPVIAYTTYPIEFSSHRYHYAAWDGAAWNTNEIAMAGNGIDAATRVYSGGIAIDRDDGQIVYASRESGAEYEMFRYTTADGGASWTEEALTSSSSAKNIRPAAVYDPHAELRVIWMYGTYGGYTSFNTGLRGSP